MGAAFYQCEKLIMDSENPYLAPPNEDNFASAVRDFINRCNNMAAHRMSSPYSALAFSRKIIRFQSSGIAILNA